jgi:hypothetical protein
MVKVQEELKATRNSLHMIEADFDREKERSLQREQEAFAARYQLVGVQEEVGQLQEQIKLVEQERDGLRMIAKNEEVARIAAEGRLPLPKAPENDEFASPKKTRRSLDPVMITSSAASEDEFEDLRLLLEWEQRRAERAYDRVEFLEMECKFRCCESRALQGDSSTIVLSKSGGEVMDMDTMPPSAVFIPEEGIFRIVSAGLEESPWLSPLKNSTPLFEIPLFQKPIPELEPPTPERSDSETRRYARTPSCEPPAPAVICDANTSLLSLLDAPQSATEPDFIASFNIPTMADAKQIKEDVETDEGEVPEEEVDDEADTTIVQTFHTISTTTKIPLANAPDLTPQTALPADLSNPALSPTMSREEALAQIRERRGRARSLAQGTMTPRKQMVEGTSRRDISAPAIRSGNVRGRCQVR